MTDELDPIPTLDLWMLLKRLRLPRTEAGEPKPGTEDLHSAYANVRAWLARVELDLGLPSYERTSDWAEFDTVRQRYGLCPKCRCNDGYLMVDKQFWSMCHRHRLRWPVVESAIVDMMVIDRRDEWEDRFRPVGKYRVVEPITVVEQKEDDEGIPMSVLRPPEKYASKPRLQLVPKPTKQKDAPKPHAGGTLREFTFDVIQCAYLAGVVLPWIKLQDLWFAVTDHLDEYYTDWYLARG